MPSTWSRLAELEATAAAAAIPPTVSLSRPAWPALALSRSPTSPGEPRCYSRDRCAAEVAVVPWVCSHEEGRLSQAGTAASRRRGHRDSARCRAEGFHRGSDRGCKSHFYLPGFEAAGFPTQGDEWDRFVDQFVAELSIGAAQHGGWGYPGAFHVAKDFVKSEDWSKPALQSLLDEALKVLASQRVDRSMVPFFALARYQEISDERDR